MKKTLKRQNLQALDRAIEKALSETDEYGADKPEFASAVTQLTHLYKIRDSHSSRVSKDALLGAGATFGSLLLIVAYEQYHVLNTKGLNFVPKIK